MVTASNLSVAVDYTSRQERERDAGQTARVIWLYGLSGSGKSTLANALERKLRSEGMITFILDGDRLRTGLNRDLGFSHEDRAENIRRVAEVARLFVEAGVIVISAFITPSEQLRASIRTIVGQEDLIEVYVRCSFKKCQERDVKGLYAKAAAGQLPDFTGRDALFEEPADPQLIIDTETAALDDSLAMLCDHVLPRVRPRL
ncbi:MAG: adenylyl-sulfate kinase [Chthoniobacterales bacterium]|nr:adenylyl-sulfate kinase [Chthoniobacterales bacterium]